MAYHFVDRSTHALWKALIIQRCRNTAPLCSLIIYPLIDLFRGHPCLDMLCHIVQHCNIDLRTFFDRCDLFRCLDHGMIWHLCSLSLKLCNLLIKRLMAFLIFFPASTPAGIISSKLQLYYFLSFQTWFCPTPLL